MFTGTYYDLRFCSLNPALFPIFKVRAQQFSDSKTIEHQIEEYIFKNFYLGTNKLTKGYTKSLHSVTRCWNKKYPKLFKKLPKSNHNTFT